MQWVVPGYLLSLAVFIPVSGWLGDRSDEAHLYDRAVPLTAASLACGLSWSIESLIAFRVLQGVGGGMLTPVGTAMIFRAFPRTSVPKGSYPQIPMVVAPASGRCWAATSRVNRRRWIFLINIPVGMLGSSSPACSSRKRAPAPVVSMCLAATPGSVWPLMYASLKR